MLDEVLIPVQRDEAVRRAREYVTQRLESNPDRGDLVVQYALLASADSALHATDPAVAAAAAATRDELAIVAALIELTELAEQDQRYLDGEAVLGYARETWHASGDLIAALGHLQDRGLVGIASNEHASVVYASIPTAASLRVLVGRAAEALGRIPVARIASALFDLVIRSRANPFLAAEFGVGEPSMANLAKRARDVRNSVEGDQMIFPRDEPSVLVRASYGSVPFYGSVCFRRASDRDKALAQLSGLKHVVWDESFQVEDVLSCPGEPVPSRRFLRAYQRLTGRVDRTVAHLLQSSHG